MKLQSSVTERKWYSCKNSTVLYSFAGQTITVRYLDNNLIRLLWTAVTKVVYSYHFWSKENSVRGKSAIMISQPSKGAFM